MHSRKSDIERAQSGFERQGASGTTGFPSPAEDSTDVPLDLHALVVRRPAATFFLRMSGDAMRGEGIHDGDVLVVDRSLTPVPGTVIVSVVDGTLLVRRYRVTDPAVPGRLSATGYLVAANPLSRPFAVPKWAMSWPGAW